LIRGQILAARPAFSGMGLMTTTAPPSTILGIQHIQVAITAGGEDRARAFYGGLLGMAEVPKPASLADRGGCWFECGPQQVHCGVEDPVAPSGRHPAFLVAGLSGFRERIEAAGFATMTDRPLPGFRRFYAIDPFGNRLEFLEPSVEE
jgi:catechol 2,3-dioxygenase-like lactoylglutathione lyase family enzyme